MKTRYVRYGLLTVLLGLVVYLAFGFGVRSFEAYCPFGGMEALWGLHTSGEFTCALGPLNLSMLLAVVALALIAKKSFCGWACPIGFLGELCGHAGGAVTKKRLRPGARLDGSLRMLRYVVLVVSLVFTYKAGELLLRGYDPYYLIFSGIGHGTAGIFSYITLFVIAIGALLIPMFFCRYLCPLGAVFDPFSRLGIVKVFRDEGKCTNCKSCQLACPHDIPVHTLTFVRRRDCTNCLECLDACPEKMVLSVKASL
jgi:polyferredoxin